MGSSYRGDLNAGRMKDWEEKLCVACNNIEAVCKEIWEGIGGDGQFDNAADDGALQEKLALAKRLIEEELPKKEEQ